MSLSSISITVYDPTGYEQVKVDVRPGDVLEYKRDGYRGRCTGILLEISEKKKPLKIQPMDGEGRPVGSPIHRATWGISYARRDGALLGIPEAFEGKVLSYADGVPGRINGWLEIERAAGRRNVEMNNHAPGWPSRALVIGETVRCEMRPAPGYARPVWFVLPILGP